MNVQTYLFFDGRCQEAIDFYTAVFGAETRFLMRFGDAPHFLMRPGSEQKVFHATLQIGTTTLNLSDDLAREYGTLRGFALLVHLDTDAEAESAFDALAASGEVKVPLSATPWASRYGVVTDQFGVTWKIQAGGPSG